MQCRKEKYGSIQDDDNVVPGPRLDFGEIAMSASDKATRNHLADWELGGVQSGTVVSRPYTSDRPAECREGGGLCWRTWSDGHNVCVPRGDLSLSSCEFTGSTRRHHLVPHPG
jgi:hypothetical protein